MKKMFLTCDTHGRSPWSGAVFCPTCKTCYQTHDEDAPSYAPLRCCGVRFMPADVPGKFSALPICDGCAEEAGVVFQRKTVSSEPLPELLQAALGGVGPQSVSDDAISAYPVERDQLFRAIEKVLNMPGDILFVSDATTVDDFMDGIFGEVLTPEVYYERLTVELGVQVERGALFVTICHRLRTRSAAGLS